MSIFKIESIAELIPCDLSKIPNDTYEGVVKGESIVFTYQKKFYIILCKINNRYIESKANVKIENGKIEILPMTY